MTEIDDVVTDENGDIISETANPNRIERKRPDITSLEDATAPLEDGDVLPLFDVGDSVVIERFASFLQGTPWLDTITYIVKRIDDETGRVDLWDPEMRQWALGNFKKGTSIWKLPSMTKKKKKFLAPSIDIPGRKKRGRPKKA